MQNFFVQYDVNFVKKIHGSKSLKCSQWLALGGNIYFVLIFFIKKLFFHNEFVLFLWLKEKVNFFYFWFYKAI